MIDYYWCCHFFYTTTFHSHYESSDHRSTRSQAPKTLISYCHILTFSLIHSLTHLPTYSPSLPSCRFFSVCVYLYLPISLVSFSLSLSLLSLSISLSLSLSFSLSLYFSLSTNYLLSGNLRRGRRWRRRGGWDNYRLQSARTRHPYIGPSADKLRLEESSSRLFQGDILLTEAKRSRN